jgi:hypothetical protein
MKFKSNIELQAGLADSSGALGTSGQILSSTATGTDWIPFPASDNYQYWTASDNESTPNTIQIDSTNTLVFTGVAESAGAGVATDGAVSPGEMTIGLINTGGTAGATTFYRGDGQWSVPVGTTYSAGNGINFSGTQINADINYLSYSGSNNFIIWGTQNSQGATIPTGSQIAYADPGGTQIVNRGLVSDLPFSNNSGTVTGSGVDTQITTWDSATSVTGAATYTIDSSNNVSQAADTDVKNTIGRAVVDGGTINSDFAIFTHIDRVGSLDYAFMASPNGSTFINASGLAQTVQILDDNASVASFSNDLIQLSATNVQLSQYGSGTKTGTATYNLSVNASGDIIEEVAGGGLPDGTFIGNALVSEPIPPTAAFNSPWPERGCGNTPGQTYNTQYYGPGGSGSGLMVECVTTSGAPDNEIVTFIITSGGNNLYQSGEELELLGSNNGCPSTAIIRISAAGIPTGTSPVTLFVAERANTGQMVFDLFTTSSTMGGPSRKYVVANVSGGTPISNKLVENTLGAGIDDVVTTFAAGDEPFVPNGFNQLVAGSDYTAGNTFTTSQIFTGTDQTLQVAGTGYSQTVPYAFTTEYYFVEPVISITDIGSGYSAGQTFNVDYNPSNCCGMQMAGVVDSVTSFPLAAGGVATYHFTNPGQDYQAGDTLKMTGGATDCEFTLTTPGSGAVGTGDGNLAGIVDTVSLFTGNTYQVTSAGNPTGIVPNSVGYKTGGAAYISPVGSSSGYTATIQDVTFIPQPVTLTAGTAGYYEVGPFTTAVQSGSGSGIAGTVDSVSAQNFPIQVNISTPGTSYTQSPMPLNVVAITGSGNGAMCEITQVGVGGSVTGVDFGFGMIVTGYAVGDILAIDGGGGNFSCQVTITALAVPYKSIVTYTITDNGGGNLAGQDYPSTGQPILNIIQSGPGAPSSNYDTLTLPNPSAFNTVPMNNQQCGGLTATSLFGTNNGAGYLAFANYNIVQDTAVNGLSIAGGGGIVQFPSPLNDGAGGASVGQILTYHLTNNGAGYQRQISTLQGYFPTSLKIVAGGNSSAYFDLDTNDDPFNNGGIATGTGMLGIVDTVDGSGGVLTASITDNGGQTPTNLPYAFNQTTSKDKLSIDPTFIVGTCTIYNEGQGFSVGQSITADAPNTMVITVTSVNSYPGITGFDITTWGNNNTIGARLDFQAGGMGMRAQLDIATLPPTPQGTGGSFVLTNALNDGTTLYPSTTKVKCIANGGGAGQNISWELKTGYDSVNTITVT